MSHAYLWYLCFVGYWLSYRTIFVVPWAFWINFLGYCWYSVLVCLQRTGVVQSFPWFWDSVLCTGVLLHGLCDSKPEFNFYLFPIPGIPSWEFRLSFAYLCAGYFSYLCALALAPYKVFYAMAVIGLVSFAFRIMQRWARKNGEIYHRSRKHSHRH